MDPSQLTAPSPPPFHIWEPLLQNQVIPSTISPSGWILGSHKTEDPPPKFRPRPPPQLKTEIKAFIPPKSLPLLAAVPKPRDPRPPRSPPIPCSGDHTSSSLTVSSTILAVLSSLKMPLTRCRSPAYRALCTAGSRQHRGLRLELWGALGGCSLLAAHSLAKALRRSSRSISSR